jgi:hypothetical protein
MRECSPAYNDCKGECEGLGPTSYTLCWRGCSSTRDFCERNCKGGCGFRQVCP